jgi:hypothetical protein
VVRIDSKAATVTLEHPGVPDLMPAGVTELPLQPSAGLEAIQVGDVVRFVLAADPESHGLLTVTWLELKRPSDDRRSRLALWLPDPVWLLATVSAVLLAAIGGIAYTGWRSLRALRRTLLTIVSSQDELRHSVRLLVKTLEDIAGVLRHSYLPDLRQRTEAVRAVRTAGGDDASRPSRSPYLFIVRRDDVDIFRSFKERLHAPDIAEVSWDRRAGERRTRTQPMTTERRRRERRGPPPLTWKTFGFVMVRREPPGADAPTDS